MPTLAELAKTADKPIKVLYLGDSGSGKTGSLASLVPDYELFILDFDNGCSILADLIPPEHQSKVHVETLTDRVTIVGNKVVPVGVPTAVQTGMRLLNQWKTAENEETVDYGPVTSWDTSRVLVIDSATFFGQAALRYVLSVNNRKEPHPSDYGQAMDIQEGLLEMLYSSAVKCNVIVTAHITWQGGLQEFQNALLQIGLAKNSPIKPPEKIEVSTERGYPSFLGKKLPPRVARYFNTVLMAKTSGAARYIYTDSIDGVELKSERPSKLNRRYPIETGMRDIFKALSNR